MSRAVRLPPRSVRKGRVRWRCHRLPPPSPSPLPAAASAELLAVNCGGLVALAQAALPLMLERKRGAIVNTGSVAGALSTGSPLLSVYAGTKAFVDSFSRSLACEYAGKGITVQCQVPHFVATAMSKIRKPTLLTPSPADYAAASLDALAAGGAVVVPYWAHALQAAALDALPQWLLRRVLMSMHLGLRARLIKKLDAEKAGGKTD